MSESSPASKAPRLPALAAPPPPGSRRLPAAAALATPDKYLVSYPSRNRPPCILTVARGLITPTSTAAVPPASPLVSCFGPSAYAYHIGVSRSSAEQACCYVRKTWSDLVALHAHAQAQVSIPILAPPLPSSDLFLDHSPTRVVARKAAVQCFLDAVLEFVRPSMMVSFLMNDQLAPNSPPTWIGLDSHNTATLRSYLTLDVAASTVTLSQGAPAWSTALYILRHDCLEKYSCQRKLQGTYSLQNAKVASAAQTPIPASAAPHAASSFMCANLCAFRFISPIFGCLQLYADCAEERDAWVVGLAQAISRCSSPQLGNTLASVPGTSLNAPSINLDSTEGPALRRIHLPASSGSTTAYPVSSSSMRRRSSTSASRRAALSAATAANISAPLSNSSVAQDFHCNSPRPVASRPRSKSQIRSRPRPPTPSSVLQDGNTLRSPPRQKRPATLRQFRAMGLRDPSLPSPHGWAPVAISSAPSLAPPAKFIPSSPPPPPPISSMPDRQATIPFVPSLPVLHRHEPLVLWPQEMEGQRNRLDDHAIGDSGLPQKEPVKEPGGAGPSRSSPGLPSPSPPQTWYGATSLASTSNTSFLPTHLSCATSRPHNCGSTSSLALCRPISPMTRTGLSTDTSIHRSRERGSGPGSMTGLKGLGQALSAALSSPLSPSASGVALDVLSDERVVATPPEQVLAVSSPIAAGSFALNFSTALRMGRKGSSVSSSASASTLMSHGDSTEADEGESKPLPSIASIFQISSPVTEDGSSQRRQGFWRRTFGSNEKQRERHTGTSVSHVHNGSVASSSEAASPTKGHLGLSGPVFGVSLATSMARASLPVALPYSVASDAACTTTPEGNEHAMVPAVVFRCIEYLECRHAEYEEGLYRLSGSTELVKALTRYADAHGDVPLVGPVSFKVAETLSLQSEERGGDEADQQPVKLPFLASRLLPHMPLRRHVSTPSIATAVEDWPAGSTVPGHPKTAGRNKRTQSSVGQPPPVSDLVPETRSGPPSRPLLNPTGLRVDTSDDIGYYWDVHAIGSLLKAYVRSLTEDGTGLLTPTTIEWIRDIPFLDEMPSPTGTSGNHVVLGPALGLSMSTTSDALRLGDVAAHVGQVLLSTLPTANYVVLSYLMAHLSRIAAASAINKMTAGNLAIVWSAVVPLPFNVLTLILTHFDTVFPAHSSPITTSSPTNSVTVVPVEGRTPSVLPILPTASTQPPSSSSAIKHPLASLIGLPNLNTGLALSQSQSLSSPGGVFESSTIRVRSRKLAQTSIATSASACSPSPATTGQTVVASLESAPNKICASSTPSTAAKASVLGPIPSSPSQSPISHVSPHSSSHPVPLCCHAKPQVQSMSSMPSMPPVWLVSGVPAPTSTAQNQHIDSCAHTPSRCSTSTAITASTPQHPRTRSLSHSLNVNAESRTHIRSRSLSHSRSHSHFHSHPHAHAHAHSQTHTHCSFTRSSSCDKSPIPIMAGACTGEPFSSDRGGCITNLLGTSITHDSQASNAGGSRLTSPAAASIESDLRQPPPDPSPPILPLLNASMVSLPRGQRPRARAKHTVCKLKH